MFIFQLVQLRLIALVCLCVVLRVRTQSTTDTAKPSDVTTVTGSTGAGTTPSITTVSGGSSTTPAGGTNYVVDRCLNASKEFCYRSVGADLTFTSSTLIKRCTSEGIRRFEMVANETLFLPGDEVFCLCGYLGDRNVTVSSSEVLREEHAMQCVNTNPVPTASFTWPEASPHPFAVFNEVEDGSHIYCRLDFVNYDRTIKTPVSLSAYQATGSRLWVPFSPSEEGFTSSGAFGYMQSSSSIVVFSKQLEGWFWAKGGVPWSQSIDSKANCAFGMPPVDSKFPVVEYSLDA